MKRHRPKGYWRNLALFALACFSLATIGFTIWLAHARAMILIHPGRLPPDPAAIAEAFTTWEEVTFPATDGLQLSGWFIPPQPEANGAALIYVHGLGANRTALLDEAAMLARHGFGALLFDLRNHGASEGTITTLGYAEVEDVRGAVAYLLTRPEVDPQRIGLFGISMGGAIVIRAAARTPEVRVVIAQSAYTSLEDNIAQGTRALLNLPPFPFAPLVVWFGELESGVDIRLVRPIDDIPQIAPRPILLIHGELDDTIPANNSVALYEAAQQPRQLYLIPNAGHGGLLTADPKGYEQRVAAFLDTYLKNDE